jgi:zinc protease
LATHGPREFQVAITSNDESMSLGGSPRDAAQLFQFLYREFTAPRLDSVAVQRSRQVGTAISWTLDDQLTEVLSRGDPRRGPMPWALVPMADAQAALAVYHDRFGNASDFTFVLVGALTTAEAKPLVERYLASLPGTGQHETAKAADLTPWDEALRQTVPGNLTPKASTLLVFNGPFPKDATQYVLERRRLATLGQVLELELTDQLREQMGGTYSVGVRDFTYLDPAPHYRLEFNFDAEPKRMPAMTDALLAVLDSVRARGAPAVELRRAAAIHRREREVALQDNHYWVQALALYDQLGIPLARIAEPPESVLRPEELRAAAERYLPTRSFIHLTLMPVDTNYLKDSTSGFETDVARRH